MEQLSREATRVLEACVVRAKMHVLALGTTTQMPNMICSRASRNSMTVRSECLRRVLHKESCVLADTVVRRISEPVRRAMHSAAACLLQREATPLSGGSLPWIALSTFILLARTLTRLQCFVPARKGQSTLVDQAMRWQL